jgi:orotate phosphoribosyltransferase
MKYRSVAQLNADLVDWLGRLPADIELIAGIPRSGLLVASLLALHRNLPVTDVDGLLAGRVVAAGSRYRGEQPATLLHQPRNVLVIDDSIQFGRQLAAVKERIEAAALPHRIRYAAVYSAPASERLVDFSYEVLSEPRCFEWNVMHHPWILSKTCMDIDGVLCRDPSPAENDDGVEYRRFLLEAEPFYLPSCRVRWLVTARLEKYRSLTEQWLRDAGVEYDELLMMDYPDMATRQAAGRYAAFKADIYKRTGALLFIESSEPVAAEIARLSGKSVFCLENRTLLDPGLLPRVRRGTGDVKRAITGRTVRAPLRAARQLRLLNRHRV